MYCKASLVCRWLFWSVNQTQKNNVYSDTQLIDVPTRDLLVIETKGSFVLRWANLNNKTNCSSMFVNSEYSYYAVLELLFYCQVYARRTICLFVLSVYVCQNNEQNHVTVDTLLTVDTLPFWGILWICDLFTSGCALCIPSLPQNNP